MDLSRKIYDAGQEVASASGSAVASVLNRVLNGFMVWPFKATTAYVIDSEGSRTETFGSVLYSTSNPSDLTEIDNVASDTAATVIDILDEMDLEQFRAAYFRVAYAKALKKRPPPVIAGVANTTTTLGIILAIHAALPLEKFADELDRLNRQTPHSKWPDMVAILSSGTINYVAHFPGEPISGDLLQPAHGALTAYIPPIYVVMVMKPAGAYTFNKMMAFLIAHLNIFSPGTTLPNWMEISRNIPKEAITLYGYQYNLKGDLLPVPRQFYNDRYLPPRPIRIEDQKGNLLCTLQFVPWQDGGVVILTGQMPLEGFLIWLDIAALKGGGILKRGDRQISCVLPITQANFGEMLTRIQRQSNLVVRSDPAQFVVQKLADEGTNSPFIARLFVGILNLRDAVFPDPAKRDKFYKAYEVANGFLNVRAVAQEIEQVWNEHVRKVSEGQIARRQGPTIQVEENIDKELRKRVESFLNAGVRVLKGMQDVTEVLKVNIGFLFQKAGPFSKGIADLEKTDPDLAEYLRQTRTWSERLIMCRNDVEHDGWILPKALYSVSGSGIKVDEPCISGQTVTGFVRIMVDRLACFMEEVTAHCLQKQMPAGISITEIPLSQRQGEEVGVRFRVTLAKGGNPIWTIAYHREPFEET